MVVTAPLAEQITERLKQEEVVWIAASLDEYWAVLNELSEEPFPVKYDIEYINGQIRVKMSQASDSHETIVLNIGAALRTVFYNNPDIRVMGSNKLVYVPSCSLSVNPDVLVMKGESQLFPLPKRAAGITNPYLLIEVLSDSTERNDMFTKLRCYKQLDSVQHIIYIDQHLPNVSVYTRQQDAHHWLNEDYDTLDMAVSIGDFTIPMQDIYHKVAITTPGVTNA
jgi:Uma2 family endonuclease